MKVSIVVPIYNAEEYLDKSISALLGQTFGDIEVILVENGSTDNSLAICNKYADIDDRIVVIDTKGNVGAGEARNRGIDRASSDYICFFDADDWYEPTIVEKLLRAVVENETDAAVCAYETYVEGTDKRDHHMCEETVFKTRDETRQYVADRFPDGHIGFLWNKIYRLDVIKDCELKFPCLSRLEDGFFNLDFFTVASSLAVIEDELYHYRISNSEDVIRKHDAQYADLVVTLVDSANDAYKAWGVQSNSDELNKFCLNELGTCIENTFIGGWNMGYLERRAYLTQLTMVDTYEDALLHIDVVGKYRQLLHKLLNDEHYILLEFVVRIKYIVKKNFKNFYYKFRRLYE